MSDVKLAFVDRNDPVNELDFKLNVFNEQEIYTGAEAYAHKIKNLLLMRPGDLPSIPEAGINIQSYRFKPVDYLLNGRLRDEISRQVSLYIFSISPEDITVNFVKYKGQDILIIKFNLKKERKEIMFGIQPKSNNIINFDFKIYDTEKVDIW